MGISKTYPHRLFSEVNVTIKQFWTYVEILGTDDCWEWQNGLSDGYGHVWIDGKKIKTRRLVYTLTYGPIPDGLLVCHTCDNRKCCNPKHLFLGTHEDNAREVESIMNLLKKK